MKLSEVPFLVIDTETTGLDYTVDKVVDIACVSLYEGEIRPLFQSLLNPGFPIPPEAMAVHHITDKMVKGAPLWGEVLNEVFLIAATYVRCAHNAAFDSKFLPEDFAPWLCTYRLARHLWPAQKHHNNQYLRYSLGLDIEAPAHRAMGDALVTAHILRELIRDCEAHTDVWTVEDLITLCNRPIMVRTMPFGKHRGTELKDVPLDYIEWALRNMTNLDEDLKYSLETERKRRLA